MKTNFRKKCSVDIIRVKYNRLNSTIKKVIVPMADKSTQLKAEEKLVEVLLSKKGTSEGTLDFLKQFARTYHVEPSLPDQLNATILN